MTAWHGPRAPRWSFQLLDREDRPLGILDGVTGGSVEVVALSRLGGSGSLAIDERGQGIDWMSNRVQCLYDPGITGVDAWPVATMLFSSPRMRQTDTTRSYDVTLLTKVAVIDEDTVEASFSVAAGTPIIATVVQLIESTGETRIAATASDATLRNQLVWEGGESKLTIINDLLAAAGYWSLWCDGSGQYRVEPYVEPGARAVAYEFAEGETAIHAPDWDREQNLSSVPNKFVVVGQGSNEEPPLIGIALNEDPDSQYSYQARGRWITSVEEGVEGDSQQVFDQLAQRRLWDAMSPVAKLSAEHAVIPLDPNQVISFTDHGHSTRATIQRLGYKFTFDADCAVEWREIS